jgi:uncharacterized lipoprotein
MSVKNRNISQLLSNSLLVLVCVAVTVSCSFFKDRDPEYYTAVESSSLEVPDKYDRPETQQALVITMRPMPLSDFGALEARPPRIASTSTGEKSNSTFGWSAKGIYLLVDDTPESVYRRLGYVLERTGMVMRDKASDGSYRFEYYQEFTDLDEGFFSRFAFWRDDVEDYSGAYMAQVEQQDGKSRIYLRYADNTPVEPDATEHVLEILQARFG